MGRVFQPLLFLLAQCTRNQLIRQIEFLKVENEILRKRLNKRHIVLKPDEKKRLLEVGTPLGTALEHLISIVCYPTFRRWVQQAANLTPVKKMGRPGTPEQIRELIVKIARETGWGYTRVLGELKKLGIYSVSRQTVVNILKANGLEPGPKRGPGTWDDFLKRHAETLWQCDFFSKRVLTRLGFPQIYAMVFLNVATRRVWISPCTQKPTAAWVEEQAKAFVEHAGKDGAPAAELITRDNDGIYAQAFDPVLKERGVRVRADQFSLWEATLSPISPAPSHDSPRQTEIGVRDASHKSAPGSTTDRPWRQGAEAGHSSAQHQRLRRAF